MGPIISADSHITEPPDTLHRPTSIRRSAIGRRTCVATTRAGDLFVIPGMKQAGADGSRRGRRQAGRGDHRARRDVRRAAPRRLGSRSPPCRPGPRRRRRRDHLSDRRHGAVQPPRPRLQEGVHATRTTGGSPSTAPPIPTGCSASARPRCARPRKASPTSNGSRALGLQGVMMPGVPGVEDYDSPDLRRVLRGRRRPGLPLSFHILTGPSERPRGPKINGFLIDRPRLPGRDGHVRLRRACSSVIPTLQRRVRRGRRRLGPALHVPDGPRVQAAPQLAAARRRSSKLPSEYFAENIYVTFQDDWVAFKMTN